MKREELRQLMAEYDEQTEELVRQECARRAEYLRRRAICERRLRVGAYAVLAASAAAAIALWIFAEGRGLAATVLTVYCLGVVVLLLSDGSAEDEVPDGEWVRELRYRRRDDYEQRLLQREALRRQALEDL